MRKIIGLVLVGISILACSRRELTPLKGPDGQEWIAISCTRGAENCWKAAGEFCPNGYINADEVQSTQRGFLFSSHMRDEMLIRCKSPLEALDDARVQASRESTPSVH